MVILNDQQIIDNTKIEPEGEHWKMTCPLPDGDSFSQLAKSKESAQKHIISWCESVRRYMSEKEEARQAELLAAKKRRQAGEVIEAPGPAAETVAVAPPSSDPKVAVMTWYEETQARIDELGEIIEEAKEERNRLRNERDKIEPIIKSWEGRES